MLNRRHISLRVLVLAALWVAVSLGCGPASGAATEADHSQSFTTGTTGYSGLGNVPTTAQNLLSGIVPVVTGNITADSGTVGTTVSTNPATLTDGSFGTVPASGGGGSGEVAIANSATLVYTLNTTLGFNLTRIDVFSGWGDGGRFQPSYTVAYATVAAPATFVDIATVNYTTAAGNSAWVELTNLGLGAVNVKAIRFAFNAQQNGYVGYTELAVQGTPVGATLATWTGTNSSDWGDGGNWSPAGVPGPNALLTFGSTGARAGVDLGSSNRSAGGLSFQGVVATTITSGAQTLTLDNGATAVSVTSSGANAITAPVVLNSNVSFNTPAAGALTMGGAVSEGSAGKSVTTTVGTGTLILGAANSYTGGTNINAGIVNIVAGALGTTGNITFGGGTLQYKAATATTDLSARIKNSASAVSIDVNGNTATYVGVIDASNAKGLTVSSSAANGVLVLSAANLYGGGTTVSSGTLKINIADAIPHAATAGSG